MTTDIHTADVAEANAAVAHDFFRHRLTPLGGAADFGMNLRSGQCGGVTVGRLSFDGTDVSLDFGEFPDYYHFSVPLQGRVRTTVGGQAVLATPHTGAVYSPHSRTVVDCWSAGTEQIGVKIERHVLERQLETLLARTLPGGVTFEPRMSLITPQGAGWFRLVCLAKRELEQAGSVVHDEFVARKLSEAITAGLLLASRHQWSEALHEPRSPARPRTIRAAVEAIEEAPEETYTVSDLAALCGTTVRSLQLGFAEHVGCSPMTYLRDVRLQRIHDDLVAARGQTVAEVAHRWGFRHMSRFAVAYRERYGETPSDTLRCQ